ncbi:MAG: MBL fold metallo-hydrolase [Bacteroidetes bacterium]|jgi:L-ascorbate metabolism protein UlaG (beta-lactamase superfamily)|nr:MBL fold metallo-hydrolase [Bacteroidota bacterium]
MIPAHQKGDALLDDIAHTARAPDALHAWWLGQSGFLVRMDGALLLFDPYLSDSLTKKYAGTDTEHIRMSEIPIQPERLSGIRMVTSTHNHTDHLDAETLLPLRQSNPDMQLVIPEANRAFVANRLGCDSRWPVGLDAGEQAAVGPWTIHAVPAAHDEVDRDEAGRCRYLGYIVEGERWTVFHSGDTRLYPRQKEALRPFAVDLAFLPINGYRPERGVAGNLWGDEAAHLAASCDMDWVVPCHYDMFTFNTEPTELFEATCEALGQSYRMLQGGERLTLRHTAENDAGGADGSAPRHGNAKKR